MKLTVLLAGMGLLAASVGLAEVAVPSAPKPAQPAPAQATNDEYAVKGAPAPAPAPRVNAPAPKKDDPKAAAAKKAPPPAKKKEEPVPVVEGLPIARAKGGFLGLKVVNSNFVLTFYDEKKKKISPDVARAALRWPVKYQPGPERAVLNPGGMGLSSEKTVKPPLNFKVFISLFAEGSDEPVESYVVDYHGE